LPAPQIVGRRHLWREGTRAIADPRLANRAAPRLLSAVREGAQLSLLQARCFDLIFEAGEVGASTAELHRAIYGNHPRPRHPDAARMLIAKINRQFESTPLRIFAFGPRTRSRWRLEQRPVIVCDTPNALDRGRKMPGARQRYYEGLPRDVAKQEQLEIENRQLRAEVQALRSVVSTTVRLNSPYASKPEPTSRLLTKSSTSNK
jgi:hypothetical protein